MGGWVYLRLFEIGLASFLFSSLHSVPLLSFGKNSCVLRAAGEREGDEACITNGYDLPNVPNNNKKKNESNILSIFWKGQFRLFNYINMICFEHKDLVCFRVALFILIILKINHHSIWRWKWRQKYLTLRPN